MTVYVDDMRARYGRMVMCHMLSDDSVAELHAMADRIGVARRWFQGDHYDVCLSKRARAVEAGAVEVTTRDLVDMRKWGVRWASDHQDPHAKANARRREAARRRRLERGAR